ncbi:MULTISPECIES: hypothetical protein [unclassified Methylophilus]|uniref:DUF6959 family protein n=1 Tax=unclassified Methylophilus TaxID=2630143 RepID=UPI000372109A|nr:MULTISPECIES: hypothetical protein [unclassified Methylophilus]
MSEDVKLLSEPTNFAVVQLRDRKYPGVVFQGDSLSSMLQRVERMNKLLHEEDVSELRAEIEEMQEHLFEILVHYEAICKSNNIGLPYSKK